MNPTLLRSLSFLILFCGCHSPAGPDRQGFDPIRIKPSEDNLPESGPNAIATNSNEPWDSGHVGHEDPNLCADVICGSNAECNPHDGSCFCLDGFQGEADVGCEPIHIDNADSSWIGERCEDVLDCDFDNATCMSHDEGYPNGMCTQSCELYCPDREGEAVTFCITPPSVDEGQCVSRCDFQLYPHTGGCRPDYACMLWGRHNQPSTQNLACVPQDWAGDTACADPTNLMGDDDCYFDLVSYGDDVLETYGRNLLAGTASAEEALAFLDLNHERSVTFIEVDLDRTIHNNYSPGHTPNYPMRGMIVHYTASQKEDATIKYFVSSSPHASTHFVVGSHRNGLIVQIFSHKHRTWHAGSDYNYNRFGFDFANAGYLDADGNGWEDYADRDYYMNLPLHGNAPVEVNDGIPGAHSKYANKDHWQPYTYYQLLSYVMVGRALHLVYNLEEEAIQRHGDVSNSRVDPGPHFAFKFLNELIFNTANVFETQWLNEYKSQPNWISDHPEAR